ncbi:MAG: GWxTD domain-containing protein [Reichenbachiella sp.]
MPKFTKGINLSKVEFSYLYKDGPAKMRYKIAYKDGTYRALFYFDLKKVSPKDDVKNFTLVSQKKFTSGKESIIEPLTKYTSKSNNTSVYELTFKVDPEHDYLVVKFNFLTDPYVFDIPVNNGLAFPLPDFICKMPSADQITVKAMDSLTYEKIGRGSAKYYGYFYKDHFSPSFPPFSTEVPDANKRFVIEKMESTSYGFSVPLEHYLYYFQTDTSSKKGVSFYSYKDYFPNTKKVDELIEPLIYIATESEYKKLDNARDKKNAFDNFWLSLIPSQKLAARTLRNYFRRVTQANIIFANYKAGWKTDMGMIYILYGPPDKVFRGEDGETWEYNDFDGKLKFSFAKVPNLFTQFHYSINRSKNLTNPWYSQVEKWRKGDS